MTRHLWLAACFALGARAAFGADLYSASAPLADGSASAQESAVAAALDTVLLRLLPDDDDARRAGERLSPQAERLLVRSRQEETPGGARLHVRFDPHAVHDTLRDAGFVPWGEPRPRTLLWLGFAGRDGPDLIGADSPLAEPIARAARRHGLPLELPLLDSDERRKVDVGALVRLDWERLAAASVHYGPDALAVLLIVGDPSQPRGRLNLSLADGETRARTLQASDLDALLTQAVGSLAAVLAEYYLAETPATQAAAEPAPPSTPEVLEPEQENSRGADAPAAAGMPPATGAAETPGARHRDGVVVRVDGVRSADAYREVRSRLGALDGVLGLQPLTAAAGALTLELRYPAGALSLRRALALDERFEVLTPDSAETVHLRYRGG